MSRVTGREHKCAGQLRVNAMNSTRGGVPVDLYSLVGLERASKADSATGRRRISYIFDLSVDRLGKPPLISEVCGLCSWSQCVSVQCVAATFL